MAHRAKFAERWSPALLSILRIVTGLLFFHHGTAKLWGIPDVTMFHGLQTFSLGWFAGLIEIACGALIALGWFTRPAAFLSSGLMAAAYFIAFAPKSIYPVVNMGDAAILYCFIFLYLSVEGGGPWGLGALIRQRRAQ
jgi:putative oxidoreductase